MIKKLVKKLTVFTFAGTLFAQSFSAMPTLAAAKYISKTVAIKIATKNAKVNTKSPSYRLTDVELDKDHAQAVWEIEFYYGKTKYEYEINAATKKIIEKDVEIGKEKVKSLALKKAMVKAKDVRSWDIDHKDNLNVYLVTFKTKTYQYTMKVTAASGKITNYKKTKLTTKTPQKIGIDEAKKLALKHAKTKQKVGSKITYTKAKLDRDDGISIYEIEFIDGKYDYDYEIHAYTGKVLDWDIEIDD